MPDAVSLLAISIVAAVGSMVNSIAGGGTLLTFPALVAIGIPPIVANATSTVALWPGALSSMLGYRTRLSGTGRWAAWFALPSLLGGGAGALLLLNTPADRFSAIVPWLVLGATLLFAAQGPIMQWLRGSPGDAPAHVIAGPPGALHIPHLSAATLAAQFCVGVYGGYFGAGIGILMLAAMGILLPSSIQHANALKVLFSLLINAIAAVIFVFSGTVRGGEAVLMAAASIAGGFLGARLAQRLPPAGMRGFAIAVGLFAAGKMFLSR